MDNVLEYESDGLSNNELLEEGSFNLDLKPEHYGVLAEFVENQDVTDINWNGYELFITDTKKGCYNPGIKLTEKFVKDFSRRVADMVNESFNSSNQVLEAESGEFRFSFIHPFATDGCYSVSIRRTPPVRRIKEESLVETGYSTLEAEAIMKAFMAAHLNVVIGGLTGAGKTEFLKYRTKDIPLKERVITIEDSLEIRYREINPGSNVVPLKINEFLSSSQAIKASLRQFARWIIYSEARSIEVIELLEAFSTGCSGITTIHTGSVLDIPDRMVAMSKTTGDAAKAFLDNVYRNIDVGVSIVSNESENGVKRKLYQICLFWRSPEGENKSLLIYDDGKLVVDKLPDSILDKFKVQGVEVPECLR